MNVCCEDKESGRLLYTLGAFFFTYTARSPRWKTVVGYAEQDACIHSFRRILSGCCGRWFSIQWNYCLLGSEKKKKKKGPNLDRNSDTALRGLLRAFWPDQPPRSHRLRCLPRSIPRVYGTDSPSSTTLPSSPPLLLLLRLPLP